MIKFFGTRGDRRIAGFILEPGNLRRFQETGDPILIDLGAMVPALAGWELMIGYAADFDTFAGQLARQAVADGAEIRVIPSAPARPQ